MKEYKNRKEVEEKYKFSLTDFFQNDEEWEKEYQTLQTNIAILANYKGKIKDPHKLQEYLEKMIPLSNSLLDLYVYAYLQHDVDLENKTYLEMKNKILNLNVEWEQTNAFFEPEIIELSLEEWQKLSNKTALQKYKRWLEEIYQQKKHILNAEEEKYISLLSDTYSSYSHISSSLLNSEHHYGKIKLATGKTYEIAPNNIRFLKQQGTKEERRKIHHKFGKTLKQYENTESFLLHNYIKNNINLAKIRNYKNPWQRKLEQVHLPNEVFENLKSSAKKYASVWHDYFKLMKEVLGLKELHSYDLSLDWGKNNLEYSIEEAEELIQNALKPLGPTYQAKLNKVFQNHYIDYCQYKGKVSGGYSFSTNTQDSRIVLSFKGSYQDILTIAHEAGHNVHHQFIQENNPSWYCDSSTFVAEVASLTNEFLLNHYMANHVNDQHLRRKSIEHTLKTFQNNFFGAIMEGEMEQEMYEHVEKGNLLTAEYLNKLARNAQKEYQGLTIQYDKYSDLMWVTRSHYYMNFYLYSYAVCVSIAAILAQKIIANESRILEQYQTFLSCGSNMYPEEIYQTLGIDLKDPNVFENAIQYFQEQLTLYQELEKEGVKNE